MHSSLSFISILSLFKAYVKEKRFFAGARQAEAGAPDRRGNLPDGEGGTAEHFDGDGL